MNINLHYSTGLPTILLHINLSQQFCVSSETLKKWWLTNVLLIQYIHIIFIYKSINHKILFPYPITKPLWRKPHTNAHLRHMCHCGHNRCKRDRIKSISHTHDFPRYNHRIHIYRQRQYQRRHSRVHKDPALYIGDSHSC